MRLLASIRSTIGSLRRAIARRRFRPGIAVAVACIVALLAAGIVVYLDNSAPVHDLLETTLSAAQGSYRADAQKAASRKAFNSVVTVIVAGGVVIGLLWFVRRSQARAERRFRALVQHSSDVYSILDLNGTIVYESP